jgi:MoaA/NifB/PqqE/SkfB family radical SAM enzyme
MSYDPQLRKIDATLRPLAFPTRFAVEVTAECNLACSMCHHPYMRRPKGTMPLELWRRCADQIAALAPETQCWFSFCGEPLLEPELLLRMLAYGESVGLRSLNINTNGMLLTPEWAEPVLSSGADLVVFGIDAFTAETYARVRVNGDRDTVYRNLEHFLAARRTRGSGPDVQVQFIEMDENEHELRDFSAHWLRHGATLKVRNKLSWGGTFETPMCVPQEDRIPCPWALTMMHVFWDGRVPRCPGDTEGEEGAGNAWQEPLPVLWGRLGNYRDHHLGRRFSELPDRCQGCKDWMTGSAKRIAPEGNGASEGNGSAVRGA